jgi:hypothetical protein
MKVFVKFNIHNFFMRVFKTITIEIEHCESIVSVKQKIVDREGIFSEQYVLSCKGIELKDDYTLADYNIQQDFTLESYGKSPGK